jgi:hypothetical protein
LSINISRVDLDPAMLRNVYGKLGATKKVLSNLSLARKASLQLRFSTSESYENYPEAHATVFNSGEAKIAFLGTGPMALSMAASMLENAKAAGIKPPKVVLLTEQESYSNALKSKGFKVVDERDGSVYTVSPEQLEVIGSPEEYYDKYDTAPQLIFGTMQMGQKMNRWGLVKGSNNTVLTAANGIPFTTMLSEVKDENTYFGHATLYAKGRVEISGDDITVTTTDHGKISLGAVGPKSDTDNRRSHFEHVAELVRGPIYSVEMSGNSAKEAMTKVIRNLTNCISLGVTVGQYPFSGKTSDITAMRYGVHLQKKCFANSLNLATFQACRALGLSPQDTATQIVENLKYVLGPVQERKEIDCESIRLAFDQGLVDMVWLGSASNASFTFNELFVSLSDKIMRTKLYKFLSRYEIGSTHPPTDAQAAALARPAGKFGQFIPTKPIENKVAELVKAGRNRGLADNEMKNLIAFSGLFDAYNKAVADESVFEIPASFFGSIDGCQDETRLLSNIDTRIMKLDWRVSELKNYSGISVAAHRKQWLGEAAIRNAKVIADLTSRGFTFFRFDVGGVALEEHDEIIKMRQALAAGHNKYSPVCEPDVLESLAEFYTMTGAGRTFSPNEVMVLGMRAKGALPWMLPFIGGGPMFVPRPTYNPNPSAGVYDKSQVLSFDITRESRYAPMIEALKRHGGPGVVVLPIIGNPYSITLTEEEEKGFIEVLNTNPSLGFIGDHAYRGYNMYKDENGNTVTFNGEPTRDVMEAGGLYEESPINPKTGRVRNLRVVTHSSSKLFNDASGPGTVAGHPETIQFLGDMLRGSYTQAHARDRKVIPSIVKHLDYSAPKRWFDNMKAFSAIVDDNVPGFRDLGYDCPPFIVYNAREFLKKHDLHPEEAQHYFMSRSPGLCGIFGGFGPNSNEIFRLGFTGEADPARTVQAAEAFVKYVNDDVGIAKFKARDDDLTKTFFAALKDIKAKEGL